MRSSKIVLRTQNGTSWQQPSGIGRGTKRRSSHAANLGESETDVRVCLVASRIVRDLELVVLSLPAVQYEALAQQPEIRTLSVLP
jgi:hypothetical protein